MLEARVGGGGGEAAEGGGAAHGLLHVLRALLQPGHLGEDLVIDGLVRLDADDQLVLRLLAEEALRRRLLEL